MERMRNNTELAFSIFLTRIFLFLTVVLVCMLLTSPQQAISGQKIKKAEGVGIKAAKNISKVTHFTPASSTWGTQTPPLVDFPYEVDKPASMEFNLDWTNYQIHQVTNDSEIEIILSGNVTSSNSLFWTLTTASPQPGAPPSLFFIEQAFAGTGSEYSADIPLTWEISLNGGPFSPMTIQPDNSLSVTFPSGSHSFKVRITGAPQHQQANGYYQLVLSQSLIPSL